MISVDILKHLHSLDAIPKGDRERELQWVRGAIELLLRAELTRQNGMRYKGELPEKARR